MADLLGLPSEIVLGSFTFFGVWFLLRLLLRRHTLAGIALAVLITVLSLGRENPVVEVPGALLTGSVLRDETARPTIESPLARFSWRQLTRTWASCFVVNAAMDGAMDAATSTRRRAGSSAGR